MKRAFNLLLDSVRDIAPGVKHFCFRREDGELLEFIPGQFVQLFFDNGVGIDKLRRSYSIASIAGREDTVDIAVSAVVDGRATERFWVLKPGDVVEAMGPFGRLILRDEPPSRYLMVATGTGVTPYRAMLPEFEHRLASAAPDVHVMLGVRTRKDLLYADDFRELAQKNAAFHFTAHYSREPASELESWERRGYVQGAFESLGPNPETDIVYLCGNPNMIDESLLWLTQRGFTSQRVRREKYISGA